MNNKLKVSKVLNNSSVMGILDDFECVVVGRGIAFGKKIGDTLIIDNKVEKIFKYQSVNNLRENKLKLLISDTFSSLKLLNDSECSSKKLISFIDHVITMYKRVLNNECLNNPFAIETKVLYEESYNYALKFGDMIFDKTGIKIPESELSFLALHFQNMFIDKVQTDIDVLNKIVFLVKDLLECKYDYKVMDEDIDYVRFLTHLKFLIHRIENDKKLEEINFSYKCSDLIKKVADDIVNILENELNKKVSELEKQLLILHITRFLKMY